MADAHVNIEQQIRLREQVLDQITNISPKDRPFMAAVGRRDATNTTVEWTNDTLDAPVTTNEQAHGFAVTFAGTDWTARTQDLNYCQLMSKQVSVDLSHESVEKVGIGRGPDGELEYQKGNKLQSLLNDIEYTLVSNNQRIQPLPNTGTAGRLRGAQRWIAANAVNATVGYEGQGTLSQQMFDDLAGMVWAAGGSPDKVFSGLQAKRAVGNWVTQVNRPVSDSGKKLTNVVNQYENVSGFVDLILERALTNVLLLIESGKWEIAWLREPKWYDIAQTGDFKGGYFAAEMTLVSKAQAASGKITNLSYTL